MTEDATDTALMDPSDMAKAKAAKPAKAGAGNAESKITVISVKGSVAWRDWIQRAARHYRTDTAKLIDAALIDFVKRGGFKEDPPER